MGYQLASTPRFYCNVVEWMESNGMGEMPENANLFRTLPVVPVHLNTEYTNLSLQGMESSIEGDNGFIAVLGHNLLSEYQSYYNLIEAQTEVPRTSVVNDGYPDYCEYDGYSIGTFKGSDNIDSFKISYVDNQEVKIGSIIIGTFYEMPHSPDLSLSLSYDFSGTKTIETRGGSSLSNQIYSGNPMWGNLAAWELAPQITNPSNPPEVYALQKLARKGRKIYDLSFSYLDDGDIFGANQSLSHESGATLNDDNYDGSIDSGDLHSTTKFNYNILDDYSFFSQVLNKTNGGQLPFLFQADKDDPTNIIIGKLDMKSFKFTQVANGVYNVKMKIREVW